MRLVSVCDLDSMIFEAEDELARFEEMVGRELGGADAAQSIELLQLMCDRLNRLYAQREWLLNERTPSRSIN